MARRGSGRRLAGTVSAMLARTGRLATCLLLGLVVATVGTVMHRSTAPWGLVLGIAVVLCAAVFARAWEMLAGSLAFAGAFFVTVLVLWQVGPGGDVLVPDIGPWGTVWILGGAAAAGLPALAPSSWFSD